MADESVGCGIFGLAIIGVGMYFAYTFLTTSHGVVTVPSPTPISVEQQRFNLEQQKNQQLTSCLDQAQTYYNQYFNDNSTADPLPQDSTARTWNSWAVETQANNQLNSDRAACTNAFK